MVQPIYDNNDKLTAFLASVTEIAVLPHVVFKITELSSNLDTSSAEMERAILVDPGFSTKLLGLANSAAFASLRRVTSIRDAVTILGFKNVRQLAMTVGVYDMFAGKNDKDSIRRRNWWRKSVDTAVAAKWIAHSSRLVSPDDAYTCGLLHLVGKSLIDRSVKGIYDQIDAKVEQGMSDVEAEMIVLGFDHVEAARGATAKWGLPESVVAGLDYTRPSSEPAHRQIQACVALAILVSDSFVQGTMPSDIALQAPLWACEALNLPAERTSLIFEEGIEFLAKHQASI